MVSLLIYGTGNVYAELKKVLKWEQIKIVAFLETYASKDYFEGYPVYTPEEYLNGGGSKFDFIVCASVFEDEMRKTLRQFQIPEEKIVSGSTEIDSLLEYPDIYDGLKVIAFQNREILEKEQKNLEKNQEILERDKEILRNIQILISRNRFYDISSGVAWMKDLALTAGGMAVSYDYMYVMLRILQNKKPRSILEMGLGQSSKILARYQEDINCNYDIVEQDKDWALFFKEEMNGTDKMKIHIRPIVKVYNETYGTEINCYTDFGSVINNKKFDFISIDGPWGSGGLSRIDILPYIPQCLEKSFTILLDDYGRHGEKNMVIELENILEKNQLRYHKAIYGTDKQFVLLTSEDNYFLCTLY